LTRSKNRDEDLTVVSVAPAFSATALVEALSDIIHLPVSPATDGFDAVCSDRSVPVVDWSASTVSSLTIRQLSISAGLDVSHDDCTCLSADFTEDLPFVSAF